MEMLGIEATVGRLYLALADARAENEQLRAALTTALPNFLGVTNPADEAQEAPVPLHPTDGTEAAL